MQKLKICCVALVLLAIARPVHADEPNRDVARDDQQPRAKRTLPLVLVAVGAAAVVGGATAVVLDEDDAAAPRGHEQREFYTNSAPAGAAALAVGTLAIAVGGFLYWKQGHVTSPKVANAAASWQLGVSSNGVVVSGRF